MCSHQKAFFLPEIIHNTEKLDKVRLYDPIEIVEEAGSIIRKKLLDYSRIYSEWLPIEKELLKTDLKRIHTQRLSCLVCCQVTLLRQNEVQGLPTL